MKRCRVVMFSKNIQFWQKFCDKYWLLELLIQGRSRNIRQLLFSHVHNAGSLLPFLRRQDGGQPQPDVQHVRYGRQQGLIWQQTMLRVWMIKDNFQYMCIVHCATCIEIISNGCLLQLKLINILWIQYLITCTGDNYRRAAQHDVCVHWNWRGKRP